jgi:(p)ppGpp synthase/HD superfamily hydrolase
MFYNTQLAYILSKDAHGTQKYGKHNYFYHHVVPVAQSFKVNTLERVVALLHDVVEDTRIALTTIHNVFGTEVATSINYLTHPKITDEQYLDIYIPNLAKNIAARRVKIKDLTVNLNQPEPKNVRKYTAALEYLENYGNNIIEFPVKVKV